MKFIFKGYALFILLVILIVVSLFIGVSQLSILDIFLLNDEQKNILFSSGIPRTVSILLSGSLLALAGLIMQQMMQNKFVSPTTAGHYRMGEIRYFNVTFILSKWSHFNQIIVCCCFRYYWNVFICPIN